MTAWHIAIDPSLPWALLAPLLTLGLVGVGFAAFRRARGTLWRAGLMAVLAAVLLEPTLVGEERAPLDDVAVIVVDRSPSQDIEQRGARTDEALAALTAHMAAMPGLDVRIVETQSAGGLQEQTLLFGPLADAIADVPRRRLAGVVLLTDGQVHDAPGADGAADLPPVHALLTGRPGALDRRITITEAPAFGLVNDRVVVSFQIDDLPQTSDPGAQAAQVRLRVDGREVAAENVPIGREVDFPLRLDHAGETVVELEVAALDGELSLANNRAAVVVNGVRDRLRVLLVSGEPHAGERTWRNILKSDPSVDLVHFTILRPPEKQDGTPLDELSLIAFPIRELFEIQLYNFDLIVFDRYERRGVLPSLYLQNIVRYVETGGALLDVSGPPFAEAFSLYRSPLGEVYPGAPTGRLLEAFYHPALTDLGLRHPVTAMLQGAAAPGEEPGWGRWLRQVEVEARDGMVVMDGYEQRPLLLLDRVGEGRIAQLTSDQIWLWSRGFEGGGPQAELVRRLAHWLMGEPSLEEEVLSGTVTGERIAIERRSLADAAGPVTLIDPSGVERDVTLVEQGPGVARAEVVAEMLGVHRIEDGNHTTFVVVGGLNPAEMADMRATQTALAPVAEATGGTIGWLTEDGPPEVRRVGAGRTGGSDWIGLRQTGGYRVIGVSQADALPPLLVLVLALGLAAAAWRREGA